MRLYSESPAAGNVHRERVLEQIDELLAARRKSVDAERRAAFGPDLSSPVAYERSLGPYRDRLAGLLGWPLCGELPTKTTMRKKLVAEDDLGKIFRVWIEILPPLETYGLLFIPKGHTPFPLVISQHGGAGTPELCSGLFHSANYNDMSRRMVRRGYAVFAPQLPMWREDFGPAVDQLLLDRRLKQLGGSVAALNVYQIRGCLDVLSTLDEIDETRIGMMGLSWGGFYTLVTTALDTRIKVALTSCFFNDRYTYDLPPAVWLGSARSFLDPEIAALVCPRPLYVEVGNNDEHFSVETARPEAERVAAVYDALGVGDRFRYHEHEGAHEFDKADAGVYFLAGRLKG